MPDQRINAPAFEAWLKNEAKHISDKTSVRFYATDASLFLNFLDQEKTRPNQADQDTVIKYFQEKYSNENTVRRKIVSLKNLGNFLSSLNEGQSPLESLNRKTILSSLNILEVASKTTITEDQFRTAIEHMKAPSETPRPPEVQKYLNSRDVLAASIIYRTGIRVPELLKLNETQIRISNEGEFTNIEITTMDPYITKGKAESEYTARHLSDRIKLKEIWGINDETALFIGRERTRLGERGLRRRLNERFHATDTSFSARILRRSFQASH